MPLVSATHSRPAKWYSPDAYQSGAFLFRTFVRNTRGLGGSFNYPRGVQTFEEYKVSAPTTIENGVYTVTISYAPGPLSSAPSGAGLSPGPNPLTSASIAVVASDSNSSYDAQCGISDASTALNAGPVVIKVQVGSVCPVNKVAPITDAAAAQYEASAPFAPSASLYWPNVVQLLDFEVGNLETKIFQQGISGGVRVSGYRPPAYQAHFWDVRETDRELQEANAATPQPGLRPDEPPVLELVDQACSDVVQNVNREITLHPLPRNSSSGLLAVGNPAHPWKARHSVYPAEAMDIAVAAQDRPIVDSLAGSVGLYRPYPQSDSAYHLEQQFSIPVPVNSLTVTARSPLTILVQDPLGRRIGFNPATSSIINEVGEASYTGPMSHPQVVDIAAALDGVYMVTATGTGTGPYSLTLEKTDEHGNTIDTHLQTGQIAPGQVISVTLGTPILIGDVNKDGFVNCGDVAMVKASFGKLSSQSGFDVRADVNIDGVVDVRDLAIVSRQLPAGARCP